MSGKVIEFKPTPDMVVRAIRKLPLVHSLEEDGRHCWRQPGLFVSAIDDTREGALVRLVEMLTEMIHESRGVR